MLNIRPAKTFADNALDVIGLAIFCAICYGLYSFLAGLAAAVRPVMPQ